MHNNSGPHPVELRRDIGMFGAIMMGMGSIAEIGVFVSMGIAVEAMNKIELKQLLARTCDYSDMKESVDILTEFMLKGGEQEVAYNLLQELRNDANLNGNLVLDLLDIVSGWCPPHRRIWNSHL